TAARIVVEPDLTVRSRAIAPNAGEKPNHVHDSHRIAVENRVAGYELAVPVGHPPLENGGRANQLRPRFPLDEYGRQEHARRVGPEFDALLFVVGELDDGGQRGVADDGDFDEVVTGAERSEGESPVRVAHRGAMEVDHADAGARHRYRSGRGRNAAGD